MPIRYEISDCWSGPVIWGCTETGRSSSRYSSTYENFDNFVGETLEKYQVPGAYVGIVSADGVILSGGYGVRGVGSSKPVDENTRFQLASVPKFVTQPSLAPS